MLLEIVQSQYFSPKTLTPKEAKSSKTAPANVDSKGVILKGYDTVAYFKQGKALKGNPAIESTYQGVTYLFASAAD